MRVITNEGEVEPNFSSLLHRLGDDVVFIRLEHPSGAVLTLGFKSPPGRERGQRLHLRKADKSELVTNRITDTAKTLSSLCSFQTRGVPGNAFAWHPCESFCFDHEHTGPEQSKAQPGKVANEKRPAKAAAYSRPESGGRFLFKWVLGCVLIIGTFAGIGLWCDSLIKRNEEARKADEAWRQKSEDERPLKVEQGLVSEHPAESQQSLGSYGTEYKSVLGNLWPLKTMLYDKTTKKPFGLVIDTPGDKVEVADQVSVGSRISHVNTHLYDRSYIIENFVTK